MEEEAYLKEASLVLQKCKSRHASTSPSQVDARGGGGGLGFNAKEEKLASSFLRQKMNDLSFSW